MRQLILFFSKYRHFLLLMALVAISVLRHRAKNPVAEHALNRVGFVLGSHFKTGLTSWHRYWRLDEINHELARENAALLHNVDAGTSPPFSSSDLYTFIPARVISFSHNKRNNHILLNVGKRHGVEPGMGVQTAQGWVGTIAECSKFYSSVVPLLHSKGSIGGRIQGKGLCSVAWDGADPHIAIISDVLREHQPLPGDSVYTYTRAQVAPPALLGLVTESWQNPEDLSWQAEISLSASFIDLNWVYVSKLNHQESLDSLSLP